MQFISTDRKKVKYDISVIVPMYNVENLIGETIHSLKKNTRNIEFLLIDDGSSDATFHNAKKSIGNDDRFKIFRQNNQGVSVARNLGLEKAQGLYITFVDSDDLLAPNALDLLFNTAIEHNADFIYGAVKKLNSEKEWYIDAHIRHNIFIEGEKNIVNNPELVFFIGVAGKLIHRDILVGLFFPVGMKFSEDTVIMYQSFLNAKKIYTISEVVYFYRERDLEKNQASATQQKNNKAFIYFQDSLKTMSLCKEQTINLLKDNSQGVLKKYYDRFFSYEVWPLFLGILENDKKNINNALRIFLSFLKEHSQEELSNIATFRFFLIKVFIDKIYLLSSKNFYTYRVLIRYLFNNLNLEISNYCSQPSVYGKKWTDSHSIAFDRLDIALLKFNYIRTKKYAFNKMKNDPDFIRDQLFPNLIKLPLDKNKIVFATNRKKPMSSNFNFVLNRLKEDKKLKIYKFLGETNNITTLFNRYYHLATAKTVFLEDYYKPIYGLEFNKNTNVVQLWHACGAFKKFSYDALGQQDSNSIELEEKAHKMYTHIITSSKELVPVYAQAFNHNLERVHSIGIPRTDLFFNNSEILKIKEKIRKKYPSLTNSINVLYAPTFRGNPSVRNKFYLNIDWKVVATSLPKNFKIIIKLHPIVKEVYPKIPDFVKDKVILLPSNESVDDMMIFSDILITDYSSLIFEYSLLNKPIVFYPYDLENYFDERGFYYPYEDYTYGDVVYNTMDLISSIKQAYLKLEIYQVKRKIFLEKFMSGCDGKSTQRLIRFLF